MPAGETFSTLAVGGYHTCGLTPAGLAYCWGGNSDGQLGDGTTTDRPTPVPVVMPTGQTFVSLGLSIGVYNHTCALTPAGTAYCWGANFSGQLGDGTTTDQPSPVAVAMPVGESFASLAVGGYHSCGLTPAGAAYCWGTNARGRLGDGTTTDRWTPTAVLVPAGVTFTRLAAGVDHTCGLTPAGAAYCWGRNAFGQVGDGTTSHRLEPVAVVMPANVTFASLVAGWDYACGLSAAGAAYCWGWNGRGRLGDGTETPRLIPVRVIQS
jgi:alpha-tubulin suppressor-like RCC1 family protein